jgi:excisionase family DNA binding protein
MENNDIIEQRLERIEKLLISTKTVLNFDELAEYTGLSHSYLYKLTSRGDIPFYRPNGKQLYFNKIEIDSWLLRNRSKTTEEINNEVATRLASKRN